MSLLTGAVKLAVVDLEARDGASAKLPRWQRPFDLDPVMMQRQTREDQDCIKALVRRMKRLRKARVGCDSQAARRDRLEVEAAHMLLERGGFLKAGGT